MGSLALVSSSAALAEPQESRRPVEAPRKPSVDPSEAVAPLLANLSDLQDRVVRIRTLTGLRFDSSAEGKVVYDYTYGSGVFVSQDGVIATAYHLVRNRTKVPESRREVAVLLHGGSGYLPVDVIAEEPRADLALIQANPRALPFRKWFSLSGKPQPLEGDRSYVLGLRAAAPPDAFEIGVIEGRFRDPDQRLSELYKGDVEGRGPWVGISQRIFPGYSGGAIVDAAGALTGIVIGAPELRGDWVDLSFGVSAEVIGRLLARHQT